MKYSIIGCGRISSHHIESAQKNKLDIIGLCDLDINKAYELAKKYNLDSAICYDNYKDMINDLLKKKILYQEDFKKNFFTSVTTDSGSHFVIAKYLLSNSINTLCEKPITLSLKECDELIEISNKNDLIFGVCQQNRLNNSSQLLKKAIDSGAFGKISHASVCVRWCRGKEYYSQDSWRGKWLSDGGAMMNQCIHGVDLSRWLMGNDVESMYSVIANQQHDYLEVEDLGVAIVKFKSGTILTIEGTTNIYDDNLEETIAIFGENGTVKLSGEVAENIVYWKFKDTKVNNWIKDIKEVNYSSVYGDGHSRIFENIILAIKSHTTPYVDAIAGRNALENILAMYESYFTKKLVKFPLSNECSTKKYINYNLSKSNFMKKPLNM
ncbi:MAG: Gfo/Idh/MocA family oxidoreductase [Spirochaetaceae bacterium]|nr:Gfo/Idh/MocA family oxidoreductase [Spirochaetaceae bacterium]